MSKIKIIGRFLIGCFIILGISFLVKPGIGGDSSYHNVEAENLGTLNHINIHGDGQLEWSYNQSLPATVRVYGHETVSFKNYLYVIGGAGNSNRVRYLDLKTDDVFARGEDLPSVSNLYFHTALTWKDYIYVIGGNNGRETISSIFYTSPQPDGNIASWTQTRDLPYSLQNHATFIYGDRLYVVGGTDEGGFSRNQIWVTDLNNNGSLNANTCETPPIQDCGWRLAGEMPLGLYGHEVFVAQDYLYVLGGQSDNEGMLSQKVYRAGFNQWGELINWSEQVDLPQRVKHHTVFYYGGRVYVVGGTLMDDRSTDQGWFASFSEEGKINAWNLLEDPIPQACSYQAGVIHDGNFYLVGGRTNTGSSLGTIWQGKNLIKTQQVFKSDPLPQEKEGNFSITLVAIDEFGNSYKGFGENLTLYPSKGSIYPSPYHIGGVNFTEGWWKGDLALFPENENVYLSVSGAGIGGESNPFHVLQPDPLLISINPDSDYETHNAQVIIRGANFSLEGIEVKLGNIILSEVQVHNSTYIEAVVPRGMEPGIYDLTVTNPGGGSATLAEAYTVKSAAMSGHIEIEEEQYAVNNCQVNLQLAAIPPLTVDEIILMRFSNDGENYSAWEDYRNKKLWMLDCGLDGVKKVYVQFKDDMHYVHGPFYDEIIYDSLAPSFDYDNVYQLPDGPATRPLIEGFVQDELAGIQQVRYEIWKTDGFQILDENPVIAGIADYEQTTGDFSFIPPIDLVPNMYRVHVFVEDKAGNKADNVANPMVWTVTSGGSGSGGKGSITGVVTENGKGLAGVTVTIFSESGRVIRVVKTDDRIKGQYIATGLDTANYVVGFSGSILERIYYYPGVKYFSEAEKVEVHAPFNSDNINLELDDLIDFASATPSPTFSYTPSFTPRNSQTAEAILSQTPTFTFTPTIDNGTSEPGSPSATPTLARGGKVVLIEDGAERTDTKEVDIKLVPPQTPQQYLISNDNKNFSGPFDFEEWIEDWTLVEENEGEGVKYVFVIFIDEQGKQSATYSDSIVYTRSISDEIPRDKFKAEYYDNSYLHGEPILEREDLDINFAWKDDGPVYPTAGRCKDYFSVRWEGQFHFEAGDYIFTMQVDDGGRLWIDDELLIDKWQLQRESSYQAIRTMSEGWHKVKMEYYEYTDLAVAKLDWQKEGSTLPEQFEGQYFNNSYLLGQPIFTRMDPDIDFDWGYNSPLEPYREEDSGDHFSVRWVGRINVPRDGEYSFRAISDDGVRIWLDDEILIDAWYPQSRTLHEKKIFVEAGEHQLWLEYQELEGYSYIRFDWGEDMPTWEANISSIEKEDLPVEQEIESYQVNSGDTLYAIGQNYGVAWQEVAKLNQIAAPYLIFVDQWLKIPEADLLVGQNVEKETGLINFLNKGYQSLIYLDSRFK